MVYSLDTITWGGSGIERVVFDFIQSRIPAGSTVVELGAGYVSTTAFSTCYDLYSVEHNTEFIGKVEGVNYIFAPKVDEWYDLDALEVGLPAKYSLVLVDGINRWRLLDNMDLFDHSALYVVHDTYRSEEKQLAIELSTILKRDVEFHTDGDYWASI